MNPRSVVMVSVIKHKILDDLDTSSYAPHCDGVDVMNHFLNEVNKSMREGCQNFPLTIMPHITFDIEQNDPQRSMFQLFFVPKSELKTIEEYDMDAQDIEDIASYRYDLNLRLSELMHDIEVSTSDHPEDVISVKQHFIQIVRDNKYSDREPVKNELIQPTEEFGRGRNMPNILVHLAQKIENNLLLNNFTLAEEVRGDYGEYSYKIYEDIDVDISDMKEILKHVVENELDKYYNLSVVNERETDCKIA